MPKHRFSKEELKLGAARSALVRRAKGVTDKARLKIEREALELGFSSDLILGGKDIIIAVINASQANPLVGILVAIVGANVLKRMGVIDQQAYNVILIILSAASGVDIIGSLFKDLGISVSGSSITELIKPTPTTLTLAQGAEGQKQLTASGGSPEDLTKLLLPLIGRLAVAAP